MEASRRYTVFLPWSTSNRRYSDRDRSCGTLVRDVRGKAGELIARLTPLGWTCIGNPSTTSRTAFQTNFIRTYFVRTDESMAGVNSTLRKFWKIDDIQHNNEQILNTEDRSVMDPELAKSYSEVMKHL